MRHASAKQPTRSSPAARARARSSTARDRSSSVGKRGVGPIAGRAIVDHVVARVQQRRAATDGVRERGLQARRPRRGTAAVAGRSPRCGRRVDPRAHRRAPATAAARDRARTCAAPARYMHAAQRRAGTAAELDDARIGDREISTSRRCAIACQSSTCEIDERAKDRTLRWSSARVDRGPRHEPERRSIAPRRRRSHLIVGADGASRSTPDTFPAPPCRRRPHRHVRPAPRGRACPSSRRAAIAPPPRPAGRSGRASP